jgi:hypothetical protein
MRACHAEAWRRRVACKSKIVAAGTAASTEGTETAVPTSIAFLNFEGFREQAGGTRKSTEGNEGNEGFLLRNQLNLRFLCLLAKAFGVAFCKNLFG